MTYKLNGRDDATGRKLLIDPTTIGAWEKFTDSITASSFTDIDTTPLADFHGLDFVVILFNDTEGVSRKFNVSVLKEGGTLIDEIYGRMGSLANIVVDVSVVATDSRFRITNNNIYDVQVGFAKLTL